jgi:hypothetical protein
MQIDKDLNSEYAELYLDVRKFVSLEIEKYSEQVIEKYSQNITTLYGKGFCSAYCYLRIKDDFVWIGWFNGTRIVDEFGFFFGDGKQIRGQRVRILDDKCKQAIAYYVEQSYISLLEKDAIKKMRKCT